jgi:thiamine biosynthesis lipoprotein
VSDAYIHTTALMGTVVTTTVVGDAVTKQRRSDLEATIERAVAWFRRIEETCTRFEEASELRQLSAQVGRPVAVSPILYRVIEFAVKVAEETAGAFDPTVGRRMETRGFNREYRSGRTVTAGTVAEAAGTYHDIRLDPAAETITLLRPLVLDVGAVAKGFAVDMAVRELEPCRNFLINAGGDLYASGHNAEGKPWAIGIRHPREHEKMIETLHLTDAAVCTSGDYERRNAADEHHILNPQTGKSAGELASVTVVAPTAMMADALATAAFVLGPVRGLELLREHDVGGLLITPALEQFRTAGLAT